MENFGYLVAAYLVLWLGIFGYLFWMSGALRGLRTELTDLRAALQEREAVGGGEASATPAVVGEPERSTDEG